MRKFFLLAIVALISFSAAAEFRWAPTVGATYSTLKFKQDLIPISSVVGYTAGVKCEMMFPGIGFGLEFGLDYLQSGAEVDLGSKPVWSTLGYGKERVYLHNIHIPFHLRFKWTRMSGLEDYIAPLVFGGPDFMILAAHSKCDAFEYPGGEFGITAGGGFEILKRWQVTVAYTWGMSYEIQTKLLDQFSGRNKFWTFNVAYYF